MHCEIIPESDIVEEKKDAENRKKHSFDLRSVIVTPKHDKHSNPAENDEKIFSERCEPPRPEDSCPSYDAEEEHHPLEDTLHCDEGIVSDCEITSLEKPTDYTFGLYEDENIKNIDDDEESVLLNGIAKIFVTQKASSQNERVNMSSAENVSSKEGKKKPRRKLKKKWALTIADTLFSVLIVAPIVVSYWKGLWTLIDVYHETFSAYRCFCLGIGIHVMFAILRYYFHGKFVKKLKLGNIFVRLGYRIVSILYTYIFSTACIMNWRGAWIIFDDYIAVNQWSLIGATIACVVILILLRSSRNLITTPYFLAIDKRGYVFQFPTRFNTNSRDWSLYILDCAFSVGVVGTLVVFVWRGVWVIFDLYLYPDNPEYSAVGSIVIGYTIVVITFSLQPLMRYACTRLKGLPRLAAVDIFLLLSFAGTVNVWRGVWNVLGLWLFPEDPELSCWITHLGCFTFLVLLNCSNSILVRGVYIDAEEEEGKCAVFPCHYLRLFFKIEREKKAARRQNLVVASRDLATITERSEKEENGSLMNTSNSANGTDNPESLV